MPRAAPLLLALVPLLAGCSSPAPGDCPLTPVGGFRDLHGLAVVPGSADELYAATHTGLHRGNASGWVRVGASADDLMGFSVHPRDGRVVWASGHPASGGNLGVRRSDDGGCTWRTVMEQPWDLHAMAASPADPDRLWAHWRGVVHRSDDGGATWREVGALPVVASLAGDALDAATVYATTPDGVRRSADGGTTWQRLDERRALGVAVSLADHALYRSGEGFVDRSADGGRTWTALAAPSAGPIAHLAPHPADARVLYAATYDTAIHRTSDGGATWSLVKPAR